MTPELKTSDAYLEFNFYKHIKSYKMQLENNYV